jgi:dTDP-4-dehydrorhamnose 3,5-epimerase
MAGRPPLLSFLVTTLHLPIVGTWRARKALGVPYEIAYKRWKMNPSVSYADSFPSQGRLSMNDKSGLRTATCGLRSFEYVIIKEICMKGDITMGQIKVEKNVGGIDGLCVIMPTVHGDGRGYFMETYNQKDMEEAGFHINFVQDNQSMSTKGVLRGLHFQKHFPQCKLVRAVRGSVFDVAVDLRRDSKTYGKWYGVELTEENKKQFLIPEGFAHGFLVLSDVAEFCYKVNDFWHPNDEGGMAWNDPEIGIQWPQLVGEYQGSPSAAGYHLEDGTPLNLSDKDQQWLGLKDTFSF